MAFFLGIDGGGSKTSCVIGDEKVILGEGMAGGSNVVRSGQAQARASFTQAILQACAAARISPAQIARSCVGAAGAAQAEVHSLVQRMIGEIVAGEIMVVGDMVISLEAVFHGAPGMIVIAGTGSIAYGKNAAGEVSRAGGWGAAISDEGSGHWIGRTAIGSIMRAQDERTPDRSLLSEIMRRWSVPTVESLVIATNASPPCDFATLFPVVLGAADAGDPLAIGVLQRAGVELAGLANVVIHQLFADEKVIPVAMSGGVFVYSAIVRKSFYNHLTQAYPNLHMLESIAEPVHGALALARKYDTADRSARARDGSAEV